MKNHISVLKFKIKSFFFLDEAAKSTLKSLFVYISTEHFHGCMLIYSVHLLYV